MVRILGGVYRVPFQTDNKGDSLSLLYQIADFLSSHLGVYSFTQNNGYIIWKTVRNVSFTSQIYLGHYDNYAYKLTQNHIVI